MKIFRNHKWRGLETSFGVWTERKINDFQNSHYVFVYANTLVICTQRVAQMSFPVPFWDQKHFEMNLQHFVIGIDILFCLMKIVETRKLKA